MLIIRGGRKDDRTTVFLLLEKEKLSYRMSSQSEDTNHHYLNYDLSESQLLGLMNSLSLVSISGEELFHDTYFSVEPSRAGEELWLRRRRNLSIGSKPAWILVEGPRDDPSSQLIWSTLDSIETRLAYEGNKFIDEDDYADTFSKPLEERFSPSVKGRFYRREVKCQEVDRIHIDETIYGITLSLISSNSEQLNKVIEVSGKEGLVSASGYNPLAKLTMFEKGRIVSEHIYGLRMDILMDEDSEDSDDEEWMDKWRMEAHALSTSPPTGSTIFMNETTDLARDRKLFDEICGPCRKSEESSMA